MRILISVIALSLLSTGCFKTAEDIAREKKVDQMSAQLEQSSKLVADLTQQVRDLQGGLASTTGQIQEIDHLQKKSTEQQAQSLTQSIAQLQAQVKALSEENEQNKKLIASLSDELDAQKAYTRKVSRSIGKLASSSQGPTYNSANKLFEASKLKEAKEAYLQVLDDGKINAAQRNLVWHNLGYINYREGQYDNAMTYFSKIYTKYPNSSYAPKALIYIARSFDKTGKKAEARATYQEVINKFPKSSQAKDAKKEMK